MAAHTRPYVDVEGKGGGATHEAELTRILGQDNRGGALKYFMKDMVGAPAVMVLVMRLMPWIWRKLEAVAHTLPYDAAVMTEFRIPHARFASIGVPSLIMNGSKTDRRLRDAARTLAGVIPCATHRELAGQTHNVNAGVLVPPVVEFFTSTAPQLVRT